MPHVEATINRVPSFGTAGIKDIVNGPIAYTPDGSPLIGPAWDLPNVWLNEGHSFGVTASGGAGWQLAEWIVEGEPSVDLLAVDPRRFGDYARGPYLVSKNEEAYENVFTIHYPDEERSACRPAKTSPIHDRLADLGAVWGQRYGWERPNWFAPEVSNLWMIGVFADLNTLNMWETSTTTFATMSELSISPVFQNSEFRGNPQKPISTIWLPEDYQKHLDVFSYVMC